MVLAAAGVLVRSVLHLQSLDTGLAAERLMFVDLAVPPAQLADRVRHGHILAETVARLELLAPITAATPVNAAPFSEEGGWDVPRFTVEGQGEDLSAANPALNLESIHPNYFETLGIALRRGRSFTDEDQSSRPAVAIVSEDVAARVWPGGDPIGKRLKVGGPDSTDTWRTIVGVAAGTRYRDLAATRPTLYLPAAQFLDTAQRLVLRSSASLDVVTALAREHVSAIDPRVRVMRVAPFSRMLDRPLARPRFNAFMLAVFACAALVLSAVGLYAVMAAWVRQRDREFAVRVALGATPRCIRHLVLGEALWLGVVGVGLGLGGAMMGARLVGGMVHGVGAMDPASLIGAALVLVAVALLASIVPVRQASRVDAVALLRS
jgi:predicted permease